MKGTTYKRLSILPDLPQPLSHCLGNLPHSGFQRQLILGTGRRGNQARRFVVKVIHGPGLCLFHRLKGAECVGNAVQRTEKHRHQ